MAVTYENYRGQRYYLHVATAGKGNPRYYFSQKAEGDLADAIPPGYEIEERPEHGQVFLVKERPRVISKFEIAQVDAGVRQLTNLRFYKLDVRDKAIWVFEPSENVDSLERIFAEVGYRRKIEEEDLRRRLTYRAEMQFVLVDENSRQYVTRRFCHRGSVDDWITISRPATLAHQVEMFLPHLGKDSLFEFYRI